MKQMRVKSKSKLLKLFIDKGYTPYLNGYKSPCNNYFMNSEMLLLVGKLIDVEQASGRIIDSDYHYWSNRWSWHKDWLEEVNPIWLEVKEK